MKLGIEAEIRVGPRSVVQLEADGRKVVVDRLGTFKVRQLMRQGESATTQGRGRSWYRYHDGWTEDDSTIRPPTTTESEGGIRYGRTRYEIQSGGVEHESTIRSATTTLAVRAMLLERLPNGEWATVCVSGRMVDGTFVANAQGEDRPTTREGTIRSPATTLRIRG
jgi:hypothetical protein